MSVSRVMNAIREKDAGILMVTCVGGMIVSVIFTYKNAEEIKAIIHDENLSKKEKAKKLAPLATPIGAGAVVSMASAGKLFMKSKKLKEMLGTSATAMSLASTIISETEKKTKEIVGEEKAKEITNAVKKELETAPKQIVPVSTPAKNDDKHLYVNLMTGNSIYETEDYICRKIGEINQMISDNKFPDDDEYVSWYFIDSMIFPFCPDSELYKSIGFKLQSLSDGKLRYSLTDTVNFTDPRTGKSCPAYVIKFHDHIEMIPSWGNTF